MERLSGETHIEYARRRAAALGVVKTPAPMVLATPITPEIVWDADLIPDVDESDWRSARSEQDEEIDAVLARLDIVEAYNLFCSKMHCDPRGKQESIMVQCPNPAHNDEHPSAWLALLTKKGIRDVGNCGVCGGFDKYTIAAWNTGLDLKNDFRELRVQMAERLGYRVVVQGKEEWLEKIQPDEEPPAPLELVANDEPVEEEVSPPDVEIKEYQIQGFDWRTLPAIHDGTFLHKWLTLTSQSYEPEEYYFWLGLQALATACGNKVMLDDTFPVRSNTMICLTGPTGTGKSIAISLLDDLVREAFPFDSSTGHGCRLISAPGSGESLIDQFNLSSVDPATGAVTIHPVNGLYNEPELAGFVARQGRSGSTIREVIMSMFDRKSPVSTASRGAGTSIAREHFMQMVTSTQPASIPKLLTSADSGAGFLNRWVFAFGTPKLRPARGALRIDTSICMDSIRNVRAWGSTGRLVQFHDDDAGLAWDNFYDRTIQPVRMSEDAQMTARLDVLAKKIVLLLAINDKLTSITVDHVETLKMLWPYLVRTYGIVGDSVGMTEIDDCCNKVEKYLKARPLEAFTVREIHKQSAARRFTREILLKSLDILKKSSVIIEIPRDRNEKTERFMFLPEGPSPLASVRKLGAS